MGLADEINLDAFRALEGASVKIRELQGRQFKAICILKMLADSVTSAYGKQEIQRALRALEGLEK